MHVTTIPTDTADCRLVEKVEIKETHDRSVDLAFASIKGVIAADKAF